MEHIKNVIFDLGGVIMDLDFSQTFNAFQALSGQDFREVFNKAKQYEFVSAYETGKISSHDFRNNVREALNIDVTDQEIDTAWNAMLIGFPIEHINFVKEVKKYKRTFILSNTNEIHKRAAEQILGNTESGLNWNALAEKAYFSHIMGDRKPNTSIFRTVLSENNLQANETLFIDDSPQHVEEAKNTGIHAIHLKDGMSILDLGII